MSDVYPALRYLDAPAAIEWLTTVLGLRELLVVRGEDGQIAHAELAWGDSAVMLGQHSRGEDQGPRNRYARGEVYLVSDEAGVRAAFDRVTAAGASVSRPLTQQDRGLGFTVADTEGNAWNVGTYRPPAPVGSPGWLEIGVPETAATREFFAALFGWRVEPMPGTNNNFTGPGLRAGLHAGDDDRHVVVYFSVPDIDAAVVRARELGATIDDAGPVREGFGRFASGTDPAGVPFGLHQRS
ncbi:VOC family protein [Rugosimonospora africana]|uniref:VOC domain-containing protein n=1 Tax=Rugosimonospora africana TaxID=556532 RepID=A0A8J3QLA3_9ACTN|nr:VOC family protein [Rugosimonospora africana]GIH13080.1 hypothetical protein Raf01_12520 [Rugosimonospora africana]